VTLSSLIPLPGLLSKGRKTLPGHCSFSVEPLSIYCPTKLFSPFARNLSSSPSPVWLGSAFIFQCFFISTFHIPWVPSPPLPSESDPRFMWFDPLPPRLYSPPKAFFISNNLSFPSLFIVFAQRILPPDSPFSPSRSLNPYTPFYERCLTTDDHFDQLLVPSPSRMMSALLWSHVHLVSFYGPFLVLLYSMCDSAF